MNQPRSFLVKLWPPSEHSRQMLLQRITENLTAKSFITEKYGSLERKEAEATAKQIEEQSYAAANKHYDEEPDGDGGSAVQLYAKECSKQILEALKRGPSKTESLATIQETQEKETTFDISNGPRSFIEAEEAEELLSPLKEQGNEYSNLCFSNRSFGIDAARVAEPILRAIKNQLKEVDLSDFIAGRPEAEALQVITLFSEALEGSNLKSLNLSNNALGEKGVRAFGPLLKTQPNLENLVLMNDGISSEAAQAISELIPSTRALKTLHFHNNMTGDEGAPSIALVVEASPNLEDFRCSTTRIGASGGVAVSEALASCTHLRKLDLRDNIFGVEAGIALSKSLCNHNNLVEVYLSYLNLEDEGASAIFSALKGSAPSLQVLDIAGNEITEESAPSLAALIASKDGLLRLNLAENELKDEGVICISEALRERHNGLKEVDVSTNGIGRAGARVLAKAFVSKENFGVLNINGNFISDEGVDELKEIFGGCAERLGPLDENDPEGAQAQSDEGDDEGEVGLESELKDLEVKD